MEIDDFIKRVSTHLRTIPDQDLALCVIRGDLARVEANRRKLFQRGVAAIKLAFCDADSFRRSRVHGRADNVRTKPKRKTTGEGTR